MYRLSSIVATLTALTALGTSQSTLAQATCADIVFTDEVLEAFPEAPSACLDIVERDGRTFAHFRLEVVRVRGREVRVRFELPDQSQTDAYAFEPDAGTQFQIEGQTYRYFELDSGQELNVYVPSDRWEFDFPDQPDFLLSQISIATPFRPAPDETTAVLPTTATPLPLVGALGILFMGLGLGFTALRRRLS
jgi:hypothetical protein